MGVVHARARRRFSRGVYKSVCGRSRQYYISLNCLRCLQTIITSDLTLVINKDNCASTMNVAHVLVVFQPSDKCSSMHKEELVYVCRRHITHSTFNYYNAWFNDRLG